MKPAAVVLLLSLVSLSDARAQISGYSVSTPALDAAIQPRLVAAAPNGNVWFAQQATIPYSIGFFTPSGHVTNFPVPCTKCATGEEVIYVWDLATAPDSSVWFIQNHAKADGSSIDSAIGRLTSSGQFTFFPIPTSNAAAIVPNGFGHSFLAIAPDGTVWFTQNAAFKSARLNPSTGAIAEYPLEMPEQPTGITIGADGKVWYAVADREIAMITPPTSGEFVEFPLVGGAYPLGLATGSDGNIWITEAGRHKIARLRPSSGIVTEFQPPTFNGSPQHIVSAPDGSLWYTESTGMNVGRITLDGASAPAFQMIATPGQQNFDVTVTPNGLVYFTGRDASGRDKLSLLAPAGCAFGPVVREAQKLTGTRTFRGTFAVGGKEPLNVTVQNLPASWTAKPGTLTTIASDATPALGTYTFTISVTDAEGCSTSQPVTVRIVDYRYRTGVQ
jgi:virginiamycin B lyase